jgi:hypothetical protein
MLKIRSLRYEFTTTGALGGSTSCMKSVRLGKASGKWFIRKFGIKDRVYSLRSCEFETLG